MLKSQCICIFKNKSYSLWLFYLYCLNLKIAFPFLKRGYLNINQPFNICQSTIIILYIIILNLKNEFHFPN